MNYKTHFQIRKEKRKRLQKEIDEMEISPYQKSKKKKQYTNKKPQTQEKDLVPKIPVWASTNHNIPSAQEKTDDRHLHTRKNTYSGEMLEREQEAQKEIERKKKRVAPHYSKGAYQYITDDELVKDLGRKM